MLTCNVILQQEGKVQVQVAAVETVAYMMAQENVQLYGIAGEIKATLEYVIASL